ncbi:alpha/beta fold hydrolase [Halorubrum lacusprofundi]|jgi:pimeloyl-ACP methyl ester carboxylesterase|uniref:alpha/beta fold hydrolase n=1 Tax=Halorubrum lacusprofundi TaxID=2247 RepID=UPI000B5A8FB4|nr:alpha/beta hydrolase [Halorubrum lacusprofundi]MCG1005640.1 alpha/beta hydrolase [Halorubrum lacusprofundi]
MNLSETWTTGTVSTDDVDLQYYRTGDGPPVLMAHGMYDSGRRWVPLGSDLAADYDVIAYDARGHGHSDAPETGYDIETRVADLVAVVNGLDLTDPILIGHSMGAATAAWAAADHPDLPRGLVLEEPSRFREAPEISMEKAQEIARERLRESKALSIEERMEKHYDDGEHDPEHVRRLAASVDECSPHIAMLAQKHPPVKQAFDEITCPALVLRRDVDVMDRVKDLNAAARLADGRLVHIPNAGHYVFRDEYDAAYAELRAFLQRV